jgi:hypothetical protein
MPTGEDYKMYMDENGVSGGNDEIIHAGDNEIYEVCVSIHSVSEGHITQPTTVTVGQVVHNWSKCCLVLN